MRWGVEREPKLTQSIRGQGSGKGTQSERLLKRWDIHTVVVGDLLRQEIRKGTPLGVKADEVIRAGGELCAVLWGGMNKRS